MVQVHVDLAVDFAKEQEMLRHFQTVFRPAAMKFRGYIDVHLLKVLAVPVGTAPASLNYRFTITYENEELRQKWVASDVHQDVWGRIEKMLSTPQYTVILFEVI
jgi:heme-degrading monooxygenase HmoA